MAIQENIPNIVLKYLLDSSYGWKAFFPNIDLVPSRLGKPTAISSCYNLRSYTVMVQNCFIVMAVSIRGNAFRLRLIFLKCILRTQGLLTFECPINVDYFWRDKFFGTNSGSSKIIGLFLA